MKDMLIACPLCKKKNISLPAASRNQSEVRLVMGTPYSSNYRNMGGCALCNNTGYIDDEVYNKLRENLVDEKYGRDSFIIKNPKREIDLD